MPNQLSRRVPGSHVTGSGGKIRDVSLIRILMGNLYSGKKNYLNPGTKRPINAWNIYRQILALDLCEILLRW